MSKKPVTVRILPTQLSFLPAHSKPEILRKPVQAVHMAISTGAQNRIQRLAFNAMLKAAHQWHADNPGKHRDTYEMSRADLVRIIDYTSPNRKYLKDVLKEMQHMTVEWDMLRQDGEKVWLSTVLMPTVGFDQTKVIFSYAPEIKHMLMDPVTWAQVDIRIQRMFRLDASAALYEWCIRYRNNPAQVTNVMAWEDWRTFLHGEVDEGSFLQEYKYFKSRKILPAMAEINALADVTIELVELKEGGRRVKNLQFIVKEKLLPAPALDKTKVKEGWEEKLKKIKVPVKDLHRILSTHSVESLEAHYRYTIERAEDNTQQPIVHLGKYFVKAIDSGYALDKVQEPAQSAPKATETGLDDIQRTFNEHRTTEAGKMFAEMAEEDQELLVAEYNTQLSDSAQEIPAAINKRSPRFLVPFYSWLGNRTWGEPSL